jgi:3-deoxy-manno-octulosonate cytidylyltransferase (CMP-KDO synthetase)
MKIVAVIPARYGSTRFPGKPLVDIQGMSMIQRVYMQAKQVAAFSNVIVATDHELIYQHVLTFGGEVMMTHPEHATGTDRIGEVMRKLNDTPDIVVNIQGDEPFIQPEQLMLLLTAFNDHNTQIATLVKKLEHASDIENPNVVKVVFSKNHKALYFSRSVVPFARNVSQHYYKHIGIYAYREDVLHQLNQLTPTPLEQAESLEQLRWLENGFSITVVPTAIDTIGIDTPEDLAKL